MNNITKSSIAATVLCLAFTAPAFASSTTEVTNQFDSNSVTVSYADLNLNRQEGLETLYSRIKTAANRVCRTAIEEQSVAAKPGHNECFEQAMENAINQVGIKNLVGMN